MSFAQSSAYFDRYELQSLFYRAPEVVFGIPFGPAGMLN